LFVGGDFVRKGGAVVLDAFATLRARHGAAVELHAVTRSTVPAAAGVVVHGNVTPNSDDLRALTQHCDIFCLPTRGDCLPMAACEAGAAGLPLVTTSVAALPEIVVDGTTGLLVGVDDAAGLARALDGLVVDRARRERMGQAAQARVRARFDGTTNAARLLDLLEEMVPTGGRGMA
jgi:glycosyltransferase involved in cell wall biosynthesis